MRAYLRKLQGLPWQELSRQCGQSAKHRIELKWMSQIKNTSRGFHVNTQKTSNTACRSYLESLFGCSKPYRNVLKFGIGSSCFVARRQFASHSGEADDFEARLMGEDDASHRGGMFTSGVEHDYGEVDDGYLKDSGEGEALEWRDESPKDGEDADDGMKLSYASSDTDSDMNVASDEEFEAEETDEELEELLANTPLFEPPELEDERAFEPGNSFRPEGHLYFPGTEYDPEELDITKPLQRSRRREPREKVIFSVEEVINNADFRNVKFLTQFIGETGNILARKEFKMRAKSHGRITKAIKTARFFGLMPYTNMGRPKYVFNDPYDSDSDFYESDDTVNEEVNLTRNMTNGGERERVFGLGASEESYRSRTARGRYGGRTNQF